MEGGTIFPLFDSANNLAGYFILFIQISKAFDR
jgi:hypothetical protein